MTTCNTHTCIHTLTRNNLLFGVRKNCHGSLWLRCTHGITASVVTFMLTCSFQRQTFSKYSSQAVSRLNQGSRDNVFVMSSGRCVNWEFYFGNRLSFFFSQCYYYVIYFVYSRSNCLVFFCSFDCFVFVFLWAEPGAIKDGAASPQGVKLSFNYQQVTLKVMDFWTALWVLQFFFVVLFFLCVCVSVFNLPGHPL